MGTLLEKAKGSLARNYRTRVIGADAYERAEVILAWLRGEITGKQAADGLGYSTRNSYQSMSKELIIFIRGGVIDAALSCINVPVTRKATNTPPRPKGGNSQSDDILSAFNGSPMSVEQMSKLTGFRHNSVGTLMSILAKAKKLKRVSRGVYALPEGK